MRAFFKQILTNLYIYCGNRQIEKMTDEEITTLLNALENVSKLYNYIPEDHQRQIIQKCLIEDKEYQNINARLIGKWFELNGKKFFSETAHKPKEAPEPVSEEKREMYLSEWKDAVSKIGNPEITKPKGGGSRMKESLYASVPYVPPKERETSALEDCCRHPENYEPPNTEGIQGADKTPEENSSSNQAEQPKE